MHILDGERDHSSAHLHGHGVVSLQSQLVLEQDNRAELGGIVFNVETILLTFDDGVTSGYTDVVDSHLRFVTTTKLELSLLRCDRQEMNVS